MEIFETSLKGCLRIAPKVFSDDRGSFFESFNQKKFQDIANLDVRFVQDNISVSKKGVVRGLHYQFSHPQGKLVSVISGSILDVAVDLRKSSKTFGQFFSCELSDLNRDQLWIPAGFAHGFMALSDQTTVMYKTTDFYSPKDEHCIKWDDVSLKIDWQFQSLLGLEKSSLIVSAKDQLGTSFSEAVTFA